MMENKTLVKNKGSSTESKNLQRLENSSQRPDLKLLSPAPPRIEETNYQMTERPFCRELWNRFIEWLLETLLRYARCFLLLALLWLLIEAKEFIIERTKSETLFSILTGISYAWFIAEWIEAYTGISIKELFNRWLNRQLPPKKQD